MDIRSWDYLNRKKSKACTYVRSELNSGPEEAHLNKKNEVISARIYNRKYSEYSHMVLTCSTSSSQIALVDAVVTNNTDRNDKDEERSNGTRGLGKHAPAAAGKIVEVLHDVTGHHTHRPSISFEVKIHSRLALGHITHQEDSLRSSTR